MQSGAIVDDEGHSVQLFIPLEAAARAGLPKGFRLAERRSLIRRGEVDLVHIAFGDEDAVSLMAAHECTVFVSATRNSPTVPLRPHSSQKQSEVSSQ